MTVDAPGSLRERLLYLLALGAELEHSLCCQYLFAAFSLKRRVDEGVTWPQLERMRAWETTLLLIARQEMEHLGIVCNLTSAIGGTPYLGRQNFPHSKHYYPSHLAFDLLPFSQAAIKRFICFERPADVAEEDAFCFETPPVDAGTGPAAVSDTLQPRPVDFESLGAVYAEIAALLADERVDERALFIGPRSAQIDNEMLGLYRHGYANVSVCTVADRGSALEAVQQIIDEGEGARAGATDCHYHRLLVILDQLRAEPPDFAPTRPVVANPLTRAHRDTTGGTIVTDPFTVEMMDLFNAAYELMLQMLTRYLIAHDETPEELALLQRLTFFPLMTQIIRPLGEMLTELPVGEGRPGATAGPSFELTRVPLVAAHKRSAWTMMAERLEQMSGRSRELSLQADGLPRLALLHRNIGRLARHVSEQLGAG